jgi:hypothetical protein
MSFVCVAGTAGGKEVTVAEPGSLAALGPA